MHPTDQVPATDNLTRTGFSGFKRTRQSSGQALQLRYRLHCLAIRFWFRARNLCERRYHAHIETGRQLNRRIEIRASLRGILQ